MNGDDLKFLEQKFVELRTIVSERWKSHADRSRELREDINYQFDQLKKDIEKIITRLNILNCQSHAEKMVSFDKSIKVLFTLITLIIGSIVTGFFMILGK